MFAEEDTGPDVKHDQIKGNCSIFRKGGVGAVQSGNFIDHMNDEGDKNVMNRPDNRKYFSR